MSLDRVDSKADLQLEGLLKARTKGPAPGSSEGAAGTGPRSRGIGGSKGIMVDEGENSSRSLPRFSPQLAMYPAASSPSISARVSATRD